LEYFIYLLQYTCTCKEDILPGKDKAEKALKAVPVASQRDVHV